jgi:hypothetical protein
MTALATYPKHHLAKLDFGILYEPADADTLVSAEWSVIGGDSAMSVMTDPSHSDRIEGNLAIVWLQGGTPGLQYTAQCVMVTTLGRSPVGELTITITG